MKPMLLPSILVLVWVLHHNLRKSEHNKDKRSVTSYLKNEDRANATRRKDISDLPYVVVPLDTLPLNITLNDTKKQIKIDEYKQDFLSLSEKKMLNLIGVSNTELKESYGPANLEPLSIYDQNYSRYIRTLYLYAACIYEEYPEKAVAMLEYALTIGTDISGTYELLGKHYLKYQQTENFKKLYDYIPIPESIIGKTIINKLDCLSGVASV